MSMKKIAETAGVSVATVSKAFHHSKDISEETRKQIFAIAKDLGVYEKYAGERYPQKIIAAICPEIQGGFYTEFLQTLNKKITQRGGFLTVSMDDFDAVTAEKLYEYHTKYQKVDGVILVNGKANLNNPLRIPTVFMGDTAEKDAVSSGMLEFIDAAVRMCKQNGHEKIAFLGEKLTVSKQKHFEKAMEREGLWVYRDMVISSKFRYEAAGRDGIEQLLATGRLPDAILTGYDQIAIGAVQALREHGLSVPEDVSVIGMNDIEGCTYLEAPLTTIKVDMEDLCEKVLELLYRKMENRYYSSKKQVKAKSWLVQRKSVTRKNKQETF